MKEYSLRKELKQIKDKRRGAGQRHSIDVVLMITIMSTMSGYKGYISFALRRSGKSTAK